MPSKKIQGPWLVSIPIVVSSKAGSKRWYIEKLGPDRIADEGHWVAVGNRAKGSAIHLCQASEYQPQPIPLEPGPWGYVLATPGNFRGECKRLKEKGIEFTHDPEKAPWGWYAVISDPDKNLPYLGPAPR